MDTDEIEQAVEQRRVLLRGQLDGAAARFDVELTGEVVNTFDIRSAGATARDGDQDVRLRVVVKDSYLAGRRLRGEVMTHAPGATIAPGGVLLDDPHLPESWWADLGAALNVLGAHPVNMDHELGAVRYTINGVRQHFGVTLTENTFAGLQWVSAHADLHWGNLRGPKLCILDWESWRPAPAGYDAATLYCNSLLHQHTARRVRAMPVLGTRSGQIALLSAIWRYLWVIGEGSDLDQTEEHLRCEGSDIVSRLAR